MTTVRQVLNKKGSQIISIPPQATILGALRMMDEMNIGAVLVMEKQSGKRHFFPKGIMPGAAQ